MQGGDAPGAEPKGRDAFGFSNRNAADKDVTLILTRSIRRKLVIGLALVFAMVSLLSIAGLSALYAYWTVTENLRVSRNEPRTDELLSAMVGLNQALIRPPKQGNPLTPLPGTLEIELNESLWDERREKVRTELLKFYDRLENRNHSSAPANLHGAIMSKLDHISTRLQRLDEARKALNETGKVLGEGSQGQDNLAAMRKQREFILKILVENVLLLETLVQDIPNPTSSVDSILRDSDDAIKWRLWLIGVVTLVVAVIFAGLIYCGYQWILVPVRRLHDAASRVANGNYSYRLKLRGRDEMVELAEMFNKMTERFQTDKGKLDREVEERSRQILRSERLAGIGFFASGVAHEINNPLQAIGAAAESLTSRLQEGSLGQELPAGDRELLATYLGMIERESTRCQQITSRVLDFARGTNGPKTRQDLTKIVAEVLDMVSHMSKFDGHTIIFDRSRPHMADVSAAEMKQVVLNLVANGLEAINGRGTMTIQILELVDEVVISVQDNGCGMTASVIQNLYEPFFTEKANGKGTGLGLSITNRIVSDHGGRIEATSEGPGHGSTFLVHLPRCAKPASSSAA